MASKWYPSGLKAVADGTVNYLTDTIKVFPVNSGYVYNAAHSHISDVVANELSGTGYTGGFGGSGRKTLASKTITVNGTHIEFDAADVVWAAINAGTFGGLIVAKEVTNDAGSPIVSFVDPSDLVSNGGDVTLVVNAGGLMQIDAA